MQLSMDGIENDRHGGNTRPSCSRLPQLPIGTTVMNSRQLSILSTEELDHISQTLGLPTSKFDPSWVGANIEISGIPDLTHLPPGTKIYFLREGCKVSYIASPSNRDLLEAYNNNDVGAILWVTEDNPPCSLPGKVLQRAFPDLPTLSVRFKKAAKFRRGIMAVVFKDGVINVGDSVKAVTPPIWKPVEASVDSSLEFLEPDGADYIVPSTPVSSKRKGLPPMADSVSNETKTVVHKAAALPATSQGDYQKQVFTHVSLGLVIGATVASLVHFLRRR